MGKWYASTQPITPAGIADATNLTDSGYFALQGGSGTQVNKIKSIYMGGLAGASAPTPMILARDSVVGATLSGGLLASGNPHTAALAAPPVAFKIATTKPQRSATLQLLQLAFNAYGGIVRWWSAEDWEIAMLGNTQPLGELSLSCMTGGTPGLLAATIEFEPQ